MKSHEITGSYRTNISGGVSEVHVVEPPIKQVGAGFMKLIECDPFYGLFIHVKTDDESSVFSFSSECGGRKQSERFADAAKLMLDRACKLVSDGSEYALAEALHPAADFPATAYTTATLAE